MTPFQPVFVYGDLVRPLPTGGDFNMAEISMAPDAIGMPLHHHPKHFETLYVVSGTLALQIKGQRHSLGPGDACTIAAGDIHTYTNGGADLLKIISTHSPQGMALFYGEAGIPAEEPDAQERSTAQDRKIWLVENAERLGVSLAQPR